MIESKSNANIKYLKSLSNKKHRKKYGVYIVSGFKVIELAIKKKYVEKIITCNLEYKNDNIDVIYVNENLIKYIYDTSEDTIAVCRFNNNIIDEDADILIVNKVKDPGNMGSIIRTAKAFNINNIIIDNESVDIYNDKVVRAMHGVQFLLNICICDAYEFLENKSYNIITTFLDEPSTLKSVGNEKFAIIVGNESDGIEEKFKKIMDYNYKIDIDFESLNVLAASAITIHEIKRRRNEY